MLRAAVLVFALMTACASAETPPSPPNAPASASETAELAASLERLREAMTDALERLEQARQTSLPLTVDQRALEEVEGILIQTLGELRGDLSTARVRPLTPRQRLERLRVATDELIATLLEDLRRIEAGEVPAEGEAGVVAGAAEGAMPNIPSSVPAHMRPLMAEGERIFGRTCALCHGARGQGLTAPGLDGTRRLHEPEFTATMILWGLPGHGMPGFHDQFTDREVAAVATYIRNAWSNEFGPVTSEEVAGLRNR